MASIYPLNGRWRAQVRRDGRTYSKMFDGKRAAVRWAAEIESRIDRHALPTNEAERTTLVEALTRYRSEVTPEKRGASQESIRIDQWLRDPLSERSLASIRSTDIAAWRDEQVALGFAPSTIRNALTIISQVYRVAVHEWGLFGLQNPVLNVRMPKNRPGRDRRLAVGEYERLVAAAHCDCNPWIEPAIVLAVETAMRLGELLSMEWSQVDLRHRVVKLPQDKTKTNRNRAVPLSMRAIVAFQALPRTIDGRVLPVKKSTLDKAWKRCLRACEIEDLHFHDLRHEATSRLFEKGLDIAQVMSITGHTTTAMVTRYAHLRASELAGLLD